MLECCLPADQMVEVLFVPKSKKSKLAIAASLINNGTSLFLILRNGDSATIPLSVFTGNSVAVPNFSSLELDNYGRTVRFGTYEVCVEFALLNAV